MHSGAKVRLLLFRPLLTKTDPFCHFGGVGGLLVAVSSICPSLGRQAATGFDADRADEFTKPIRHHIDQSPTLSPAIDDADVPKAT